jgi:RHS repeat-associated protein
MSSKSGARAARHSLGNAGSSTALGIRAALAAGSIAVMAIASVGPVARQPSTASPGPILVLPAPVFTEQPATTPTSPDVYCAGLNCAPKPVYSSPNEPVDPGVYCAGLGCGNLTPVITPAPGAPAGPPACAGLNCGGLTEPIAPSGSGTSPGVPCMGLNCGGSPAEPPTPPGPVPSDPVCAGIGCGLAPNLPASGSPSPNPGPPACAGMNCPGLAGSIDWTQSPLPCSSSPSLRDTWCGPGVPSTTQHPVDLSTGFKFESATDLVVPLPGPDFVLSRSYSSQVALNEGVDSNLGLPMYSGWHWALNVGKCLYVDGWEDQATTPPPFIALSTPGGTTRYNYDSGTASWKPTGGTAQVITAATLTDGSTTINVWRLTEPGGWTVDFDRRKVEYGTMGLPIEERDSYGHVRRFVYSAGSASNPPRLTSIYLGAKTESAAAAVVDFTWDSGGRLEKAEVFRTPGSTKTLVSKAVYTYFAGGQGYSSDVGTDGDLIQVQTWQPVDRSEDTASGSLLWHVTSTQYRYYDGEGEDPAGLAHQLKAVIAAQQIEFAAQRDNAGSPPAWDTVVDFAGELLEKADGDTAFTEGSVAVTVRDLSSKVIVGYDLNGRVTAQDLLTGCGCSGGGGGTLGTRETYEYIEWPSSPTAGRTMVVRENLKDSGGAWQPVRTRFHDLARFEPQPSSGLYTYMPVHAAVGLGDGSSGPYWVTRIDYTSTDPKRRVSAMYGPDAISAYTPATTSAAPTATVSTSAGAHMEYTYTAEGRLATASIVKQGTTPVTSILLRNTYDSGFPWLATKSEIATKEGMSASDMSNSLFAAYVQVVDLSYGFFGGGFGAANPNAISWMEARFEAETVGENGPGSRYASHTLFSEDGFPVFQRLADNALVKRTFDPATGATLTIESNAPNTGISSMPHPSAVSGMFDWNGRHSAGGSLTYTMTYDLAGRLRTLTLPGGSISRYTRELRAFNSHLTSGDGRPGVLYFALVGLPFQVPGTSEEPLFTSPASVTWSDAAGVLVGACDYPASAKENQYGSIFPSWPYTMLEAPVARRSVETGVTGQTLSTTAWHDMAGLGDGAGRYTTRYSYDAEGRLRQVVAANRTIARTAYDALGRVQEMSEGSYAFGGDPDAATTYTTATIRYDGATGTTLVPGNSLVTSVDVHTGETSPAVRTTTYLYDWRSRLAAVTNPVPPHAVFGYDNTGRTVEAASLSSPVTSVVAPSSDSIASVRLAYASASYSQRGNLYRTRVALAPTSTSLDDGHYTNYAESHVWYDPAGRVVGAWGPSAPMAKNSIDGLGRASATYVVDLDTDPLPGATGNYAAVFDRSTSSAVLTNNVVLEQTFPQYRSGTGFLDLVKHQSRVHTLAETVKGDIDGSTKSVTTWLAYEYDAAGRTVRTLDFGTNLASGFNGGGTAPTSSGSPLVWSGNVTPLVDGVEYDTIGRATVTVAPRDPGAGAPLKTRLYYDALGSVVGTIANWTGASLEWNTTADCLVLVDADPTKPDENQAASVRPRLADATPAVDQIAYTFVLSGSTWTQVRQTTRTVFGVTYGTGAADSRISSNDLVAELRYPDESNGAPSTSDRHLFAYDRQGSVRWKKDQRGVEHAYTLDAGGRLVLDDATGGDSATDDWADAVSVSYDSNGRVATVKTLKHNTSPDPDTVLNAVGMSYTALGLLEHFDQNPLGDLTYTGGTTPSGTTRRVQSMYDMKKMADGNWIRSTGSVYPGGDVLDVSCGTSGTSYRISRYKSVGFHGLTAAAEYQFLGAGTPVVTTYAAPGIRLDYSMAQAGTTAAGAYPGLDPFGRVVRQLWIDAGYAAGSVSGYADRPAVVDTSYAYTRLGSMTAKLDARPGATMLAQHAYTMDGLLRLLQDQRGTAAFSSAQAKPGSQLMAYDFIGNLRTYSTDTSDSGAFASGTTAANDGAFNMVNEQTGSTHTPPPGTTPQALAFTWDDAGNLLQRGIAGTTTFTWKYKHDRWGRLTQVDQMNDTTAEPALRAQYSGLGMRCVVDRAPDSWVPPATPAAPTISERRLGYFGASWQLLEEHIDHDYPLATSVADIDEVEQLVWGLRHIDDLVLRRVNANFAGGADTDWTDSGDREGDQFLNDVQFSVAAVVDSEGALLERVEYDPYGQAQHHYRGDINGAGGVTQADVDLADLAKTHSIGDAIYNADADIDRDGEVEQSDVDAIDAQKGTAALATGRISAYGNTVGWCGYRFNAGPNIYTVRFRHFDPTPGVARWLERDPAGYMDGASLYGYGAMSPFLGGDPFGLDWLDDAANFFAGFADSLTFGATDALRESAGWNERVDHGSGWYVAGEVAEIAIEVAVTGGSGALKGMAARAGRKAIRKAADNAVRRSGLRAAGHQVHHVNTIWGHMGHSGLSHFPLGGLPSWIHSSGWNLAVVTYVEHRRLHARAYAVERILVTVTHPLLTLARSIRNLLVYDHGEASGESDSGPTLGAVQARTQGSASRARGGYLDVSGMIEMLMRQSAPRSLGGGDASGTGSTCP